MTSALFVLVSVASIVLSGTAQSNLKPAGTGKLLSQQSQTLTSGFFHVDNAQTLTSSLANVSSSTIQPLVAFEDKLFGGFGIGKIKGGVTLDTALTSLTNVHDRIYEFIRLVAESSATNCSESNHVIMPDGIIKQYGFNSFHDQALVAVNRANMLTRLWKYAPDLLYRNTMQAQYLLYTSVRSIVEQNKFIYAAGNCYLNTYDGFPGLFAPYAWRQRGSPPTPAKDAASALQVDPDASQEEQNDGSFLFDHTGRRDESGARKRWAQPPTANVMSSALPPTNAPTAHSDTNTASRAPVPPQEQVWVKDLSREYSFGMETEWIREPLNKAQEVLRKANDDMDAYTVIGFNRFRYLNNTMSDPIEESILQTRYEYGHWSKPYFDCGGGNIWMMTYTVGFFGYDHERQKYFVKGTSGIDIELQNVDIDQCPSKNLSTVNVFADTARCHKETTQCEHVGGRGFIIGSYVCVCKPGFYYPDAQNPRGFFNGTIIEFEYSKMRRGLVNDYNSLRFKCLPCAEGCETCVSGEPCVIQLNWTLRTALLVVTMMVMGFLPVLVWFTIQLRFLRVVKAASPMLLIIILAGAFLLYGPVIVMYPVPSVYSCTAKFWLREVGFCISYGALLLKTWRIASVFHVRSAQRIRITDMNLIKRLCVIVGSGITICAIRTAVDLPQVEIGRTEDGKKARMCSMGWGDHMLFMCEMMLLLWGIKLCFSVRKAPSEFNESKFISWAIYNETLLSLFLNISMIFLKYPANPDLVYILHFVHSQLTITVVLGLLFGSKAYMIYKGQGVANQELIHTAGVNSNSSSNHYLHGNSMTLPSTDMSMLSNSGGNNSSKQHQPAYSKQNSSASSSQQQQQHLAMPKIAGSSHPSRRFISGIAPAKSGGAILAAAAAAADAACLLPANSAATNLSDNAAQLEQSNYQNNAITPDIQEELRRLYMQLELLKLRNMRQNNPALTRSIRQMSSAFHYFMNDYLSNSVGAMPMAALDTRNVESTNNKSSLDPSTIVGGDMLSSTTNTTQSEHSRSSES